MFKPIAIAINGKQVDARQAFAHSHKKGDAYTVDGVTVSQADFHTAAISALGHAAMNRNRKS